MNIDLNEHTREAVLFTLAELTDKGSVKLECKESTLHVNCEVEPSVISSILYLNDLREMEEEHRPYVNRLYVNSLDIYRRN